MKKIVLWIVGALMLTASVVGQSLPAYAKTVDESNEGISAKSYCLIDYDSGKILAKQNETERLQIASMCKIMTLNLIFDEIEKGALSFDESISVSETASGMGGSQIFLEANAEYPVESLVEGIVVASANDACVALAERISGSQSAFVEKMNQKAEDLMMENTVFVNATGLPQEGQYSCALDVSRMFRELLNHKDYFRFSTVWMDKIEHPEGRYTEIANTNKLIRYYDGCDAGKTGYTSEAGHCLAASAKRGDFRQIAVAIKEPDSKTRFKDVSNLFDYGFKNYCTKTVLKSDEKINEFLYLENAKTETVDVYPETDARALIKKGENPNFEHVFYLKDFVKAPLKAGDVVGEISIFQDGVEILTVNAIVKCDVKKANYFDNIKKIANLWTLA